MPDESPDRAILNDPLILAVMALMAIGLVMVASAHASLQHTLAESVTWSYPFGRQLAFASVGIIVLLVSAVAGRFLLQRPALMAIAVKVLLALAILGLVAVLVPAIANPQRGSSRWLRFTIGGLPINVQPSEFAKLALVVSLAWFLGARRFDIRDFRRGFVPACVAVALLVALVGTADFGTAALMAVVGGVMLLVAGARWLHLALMAVVGSAGLAALIAAEPYRIKRLLSFLWPMSDPLGSGYQPLQSLASIATGGWTGVGLGAGIQKHGYVPESHTDFIMAVICEETGVVGAGLVMGLFCCIVVMGIQALRQAPSPFECILATGLTSVIGWQAVMNIAVVTVVAPTTGIPLPFVSAGGSGLLTFCAITGLLVAVRHRCGCGADNLSSSSTGAIRMGRVAEALGPC